MVGSDAVFLKCALCLNSRLFDIWAQADQWSLFAGTLHPLLMLRCTDPRIGFRVGFRVRFRVRVWDRICMGLFICADRAYE